MTEYNLDDLARYETTRHAAAVAAARMMEVERGDPALVTARHREALRLAHEHAAACVALGLDPVVAHPQRQRDVWNAIEANGLSTYQSRSSRKNIREK